MAVKKEEVEAVEKEAKDKHEKDWEGKGHYNVQLMSWILQWCKISDSRVGDAVNLWCTNRFEAGAF